MMGQSNIITILLVLYSVDTSTLVMGSAFEYSNGKNIAQDYEDTGSEFYIAPTKPCRFTEKYVESCGKCDQCPDFTSRKGTMCGELNADTCKCELRRCYSHRVFEPARICDGDIPFVPEPCNHCAKCHVDECQTFNLKTCKCHTKFSCRNRAAKLRACADPRAEYVEKCGTCAACLDKCQWFNTEVCKSQTATSWEGCAK